MRCEIRVLALLPVPPFITSRQHVADRWQGKYCRKMLFESTKPPNCMELFLIFVDRPVLPTPGHGTMLMPVPILVRSAAWPPVLPSS